MRSVLQMRPFPRLDYAVCMLGPCGGPGLKRVGSDDSSKPSGLLFRRPLRCYYTFIFSGGVLWPDSVFHMWPFYLCTD